MKSEAVIGIATTMLSVLASLEQGNAKEAIEEIEGELQELAIEKPDEFFDLLRNCSWDRPSAWWAYCGYTEAPKKLKKLELAMHASCEEKETRKLLKEHFATYGNLALGRRALRILNSQQWDT
jgi:hypothetical protein